MLVGDYLIVDKTAYGPKLPQTPVSMPFIHNALPGGLTPSYTRWFTTPYIRLPGWRSVKRYDAVVFSFPLGDTVYVDPVLVGHDTQALLRREGIPKGRLALHAGREEARVRAARKGLLRPVEHDV